MSQTKRYLESLEYTETENMPSEIEALPLSFTEIDFGELKLERILFRHKNFDSSEVISKVASEQIIAITYRVGKGFSQSFLRLVKEAAPNLRLKIAFNFIDESGNNPNVKYGTKDINKLIGAFRPLFEELSESASIEVIVTTDNHIKLLQFDDNLMIGSMNFSQTADGLTEDKLLTKSDGTTLKDNFRNHELICHFTGNAQGVAEQVFERLANTKDAVTLHLKKCDYFKQLFITCSKLKLPPLSPNNTIEKHLAKEKEIEVTIRSLLEEVMSAFLVVELDIVSIDKLNYFSYDDLVELHSLIVDYPVEELIDFIQEYACFISCDLHEIHFFCEYVEELWHGITNQLIDSELDLEQLKDNIIEQRYDNDLDDGEGEPVFGPKSQDIYHTACHDLHQELKDNLAEVIESIPTIGDEIGSLIFGKRIY
ncbi:hypothetical protein J4M96_000394 [Vibrio parahaemolyticus]|nr:hypothetical protein [Vibrio parahaemolyticus]